MDLNGIANAAANVVSPNITVTVLLSTGATQSAPGARRTPTYAAPVTGPAQVQALDTTDLQQISGLNIQGVSRTIYLRGALAGVVRETGQGGDLVQFNGQTWLVVKVVESWPLWTKAIIVLQSS